MVSGACRLGSSYNLKLVVYNKQNATPSWCDKVPHTHPGCMSTMQYSMGILATGWCSTKSQSDVLTSSMQSICFLSKFNQPVVSVTVECLVHSVSIRSLF